MTVADASPPFRVVAALASTIACSMLAVFVLWLASSNGVASSNIRNAIFQNLQDAVVIVDSEDVVVEVNDRAEEMFSTKLPKSGVRRNSDPIKFEDLIQIDRIYFFRDEEDAVPEHITYGAISEARAQLLPSQYFARTKADRGRWIRIVAKPILFSDLGRGDHPATFGVISELSKSETKRIGKALDAKDKENSS